MENELQILLSKIYTNKATSEDLELYKTKYMTNEEREIGKPLFEMDDNEQAKYKVLCYNNEVGELKDYDCKKCRNKGQFAYLIGNQITWKECDCMKTRKAIANMVSSGLGALLKSDTFEKYEATEPWQKSFKATAERFTTDNNAKCFLALGQTGAGKSHMCTAICRVLMEAQKEVVYVSWLDIAPKLKALKMDANNYDKEIGRLKNAEVLYIDDFLKDSTTEANRSLANEILDYRYNLSKTESKRYITIISSEMLLKDFINFDEALAGRFIELSGNYINEFIGKDKNFRLKNLK
jgi:DNA replication protein DnaC